jgi:hypothetical protein
MMKPVADFRKCAIWNRMRELRLTLLALVLGLGHASAGAFEAWLPDMDWRIGQGIAAPWATAGSGPPRTAGLAGQRIRFSATRVAAPHPLACGNAQYEYVLSPAEGLFQGALPQPAARSARAIGIFRFPVLTLRVTCDGGAFDYHLTSPGKALIGLDNIVWPLARRGGEAAPEHAVLGMFQSHMTHDMGFTPSTVALKRAYLTDGLRAAISAYFRRPVPQDEVPTINGDPFTNSQEYPTRFVPGRASVEGGSAVMPVRMGDEARTQMVEVLLQRERGQWRVDDLRYEDGGTLRGLLKPARK